MAKLMNLTRERVRQKRRSKPRRPPGYDDPAYLAAVRKLPCCARDVSFADDQRTAHRGRVHAHHAGAKKGTGLKPPDDTAIPLCANHHTGDDGWHSSNGFASGWTREARRSWADARIAETQAKLASRPCTLGEAVPF